ncbi:MAG: helix-turn-helix transcriptional regulator, partial [Treponema sp.]|nr:helix-turn-helix transcriptional regulator [Treponema sp.]
MDYSYSLQTVKKTVVDIPATSRLLKELRNKNGYSVKQLQEIFGFETPVAIYAWENEKCKNIPCIENFDTLAKLYKCHVEDLYILKQIDFSNMEV